MSHVTITATLGADGRTLTLAFSEACTGNFGGLLEPEPTGFTLTGTRGPITVLGSGGIVGALSTTLETDREVYADEIPLLLGWSPLPGESLAATDGSGDLEPFEGQAVTNDSLLAMPDPDRVPVGLPRIAGSVARPRHFSPASHSRIASPNGRPRRVSPAANARTFAPAARP